MIFGHVVNFLVVDFRFESEFQSSDCLQITTMMLVYESDLSSAVQLTGKSGSSHGRVKRLFQALPGPGRRQTDGAHCALIHREIDAGSSPVAICRQSNLDFRRLPDKWP